MFFIVAKTTARFWDRLTKCERTRAYAYVIFTA